MPYHVNRQEIRGRHIIHQDKAGREGGAATAYELFDSHPYVLGDRSVFRQRVNVEMGDIFHGSQPKAATDFLKDVELKLHGIRKQM